MKNIKSIVIYGPGVMGASMAQIFAQYGYDTILLGRSEKSIQKAVKLIDINQESSVKAGILTAEQSENIKKSIKLTTDSNCFANAEYIIETIVEDMKVKKEFYRYISDTAPEDCIIVTNTSGLSVSEMAKELKNPERFAGMHWINPPHLVPLIEIIRGENTADETVETVMAVCENIHKKAVVVKKECAGFIFNRLQYAILREAAYIAENGWDDVQDIDDVVKYGLGMRYACIGPFRVADIGGLDTFNRISKYLVPDLSDQKEIPLMKEIVEEKGGFGVKNGLGFYDYSDGKDIEAISERDELFIKILTEFYKDRL